MERSWLILAFVLVACVLLLQTGCQKQTASVEELETKPAATAPVVTPPIVAPQPPPQIPPVAKPEPAEPGPKITFQSVVHDFGEIGPRTKNTCEFKFTNAGNALLKINEVSRTCGCTASALAKKEYAAAESGAVTVTYNAGPTPGVTSRNLYVSSNDKKNPKVALTVKAKVVLKVTHEPEKLNLLLKDENAGLPNITLASIDGQAFAVKSVTVQDNCITVPFDSSVKATKFVLTPKADMEKLKRNLRGNIRIGLTHPQCDMVNIPFDVLPRLTLTPASLVIRDAEPQRTIRREVWVLNNYGEDFEVESASSQKGVINVLGKEKIDNRYKIELEITPPADASRRFFADTLDINIKDGEKLSVNCRGFYSVKSRKPSGR
ncbi:MAG TPA: DUF1573 domain-containing protein [Sedimentisphaerales bacterium]|nr:DUF1573 domain-containing protein [Sedimentisphaerales bacterium]